MAMALVARFLISSNSGFNTKIPSSSIKIKSPGLTTTPSIAIGTFIAPSIPLILVVKAETCL